MQNTQTVSQFACDSQSGKRPRCAPRELTRGRTPGCVWQWLPPFAGFEGQVAQPMAEGQVPITAEGQPEQERRMAWKTASQGNL